LFNKKATGDIQQQKDDYFNFCPTRAQVEPNISENTASFFSRDGLSSKAIMKHSGKCSDKSLVFKYNNNGDHHE